MDQTTAFSPPLACELLDGSRIKFARVTMDMWSELTADINAARTKAALDDLNADTTLKPRERAELRMFAFDATVPLHVVMNMSITQPTHITNLLTLAAKVCGHTDDQIRAALKLIPAQDQNSIAHQIAMLPVVRGARGTDADPIKPGVDLSQPLNDSTDGEKPADCSASTESTPANSPTEPSAST